MNPDKILSELISLNIKNKLRHQRRGTILTFFAISFVIAIFILFWKQILVICGVSLIGFLILCIDSFKK